MKSYLILLRGVNVGGKNKVPMATLRKHLEELGFSGVSTYIASGNVLLRSKKGAAAIRAQIEKALPKRFVLDSARIKVLVLARAQLESVVKDKPRGFGAHPEKYYSDAIFLIDIPAAKAMTAFDPREGVDRVWKGRGVIYSERLGSERTKSRLSRITASPLYKSMTIRSWSTATKLLELMKAADARNGA